MLIRCRGRANRQNLPFGLEISDIVIPEYCPVLGIPLTKPVGDGRASPGSPSLDRIYPSKGYVKGNVLVISNRANLLKKDATISELQKLASFYSQFEEEK